jgi:hypothetical protein
MPRSLASLRRAAPLAAALALAGACAPAPAVAPVTEPARPAPSVVAAEPPLSPPAHLTAGAMPGDAELYVEAGSLPEILASAEKTLGAAPAAEARASFAKAVGVDGPLADRLLAAAASFHVGGRRFGEDFKAGASVVFTDAQPLRDVIARGALIDAGAFGPLGRRLRPGTGIFDPGAGKSGDDDALVWFEGPRLLFFGEAALAEAVRAVVEGRAPGLTDPTRSAGLAGPDERRRAFAFVAPALLRQLAEGKVRFTAPLSIAYGLWEGGVRGAFRTAFQASDAHGILPYLPPARALALARRLPAETTAYVALSTALPYGLAGGVHWVDLIRELGGDEVARAERAMVSMLDAPMGPADLMVSFGGEGVLGVVVRPGVTALSAVDGASALIWVQELVSPLPARQVLSRTFAHLVSAQPRLVLHAEPGGFSVEPPRGAGVPLVRARIVGGRLLVAAGPRDLVERATLAVEQGRGTLGDDAAHARALGGLPARSQVRLWVDLGRALELAAAAAPPAQRGPLDAWRGPSGGAGRITSGFSFTAIPEGDQVRFELDEVNGVGVLAALGIFGVRRYLSASKAAEAKNTLGALTRAAVAAYERERLGPGNAVVHRLCKSAAPVPAAVPRGLKYLPSTQPGADWDAGDDATGWRCLEFALTEPVRYQYQYIAGGPYKSPRRGGFDPGPDGFEVSAEGDLDGNGKTSLFARYGTVDVRTQTLRVSPEIFVVDERE